MSLKARYEPDADRMRLVFQPEGGEPQVFWVMRKQWLGLLFKLRQAAQKMGVELAAPAAVKPPKGRPPKDPVIDALSAVLLEGFRVRLDGDTLRLGLVIDKKTSGLVVKAPGLRRLEEMVAMQSERAGWDADAAMKRLEAVAASRIAIRQFSK